LMGSRTSSNKVGGREQTEAAWFSLAPAMATQKLNTKRMERKPESCETATPTELQAFCKHKMLKHILKIPQTLCVCVCVCVLLSVSLSPLYAFTLQERWCTSPLQGNSKETLNLVMSKAKQSNATLNFLARNCSSTMQNKDGNATGMHLIGLSILAAILRRPPTNLTLITWLQTRPGSHLIEEE
jgi:hypothetical protein